MKTIGLIGGMGWRGTLRYYEVINSEVFAQLGGSHSAKILIDSHDFHPIATASTKAEYQHVGDLLVGSARRLEKAGAKCIAMACNTVHRLAPQVEAAVDVPFLHIADTAREALVRDGHKHVGLLGTRATMQASFYRSRISGQVEFIVPEQEFQEAADRMARELNQGCLPEQFAPDIKRAAASLATDGCTALLLACTEFGLVLGQDSVAGGLKLPIYDSGELHAKALAEFALCQ